MSTAVRECYCAFGVALVKGCDADEAFSRLSGGPQGGYWSKIPESDLEWLVEQRKLGVPYKVLGEMYGVSAGTVHVFMKRRGVLEYVLKAGGNKKCAEQ